MLPASDMALPDMRAIDVFVKGVIIDCYKTVPEDAQVVVTCVQNYANQGERDFTLDVAYIANKKQRDRYTGAVQIGRGESLPDHATSIRNMIAAHGIPSTISSGRIEGKSIDARIVELDTRVLWRKDFGVDQAGDILGVAPADVANMYYKMNKREVSGRCISGPEIFAIGLKLRLKENQILDRLEAYYTR
jgi:hypothetical protein